MPHGASVCVFVCVRACVRACACVCVCVYVYVLWGVGGITTSINSYLLVLLLFSSGLVLRRLGWFRSSKERGSELIQRLQTDTLSVQSGLGETERHCRR